MCSSGFLVCVPAIRLFNRRAFQETLLVGRRVTALRHALRYVLRYTEALEESSNDYLKLLYATHEETMVKLRRTLSQHKNYNDSED